MKIKFGSLVSDGRGKIGGHVASKNRAGAYIRTKVTPVNPSSLAQVNVRQRLATLSSGWRGLTNSQRLQWNNAVSSFSKTDIFGDIRNPTGANLYQKLNNQLAIIGVGAMDVPPLPVAVPSLSSLTVTQASGGATSLGFAESPLPAGHTLVLRATPAQSPGKSFVKSEFRIIGLVDAGVATPFVATTQYNTKFGAPGEAGQKVFVEAFFVNEVTGQKGLPIQAVALIS